MTRWLAASTCVLAVAAAHRAFAADVATIGGDRLALDLTETSVAGQRFDARGNERAQDSGWGEWVNRLDVALRWGSWTGGLRLDSALYWRRPVDSTAAGLTRSDRNQIRFDNESRFGDSLYPAKLWMAFVAPGIEVTAGDAYVQFGRGLTLSLRKLDELGIDTTLRGAKVHVERDAFAFTAVAGFANPSRVDEATGRTLFPLHDVVLGDRAVAVFGSDRIVGVDVQAGRGLPVTLATHAAHFTRCSPYRYDPQGNAITDVASDPGGVVFGTCDGGDTARWLKQLGGAPPSLNDREITMVGQSLEIPSLWHHGKLYVEAAAQERLGAPNGSGNALYGALSVDVGRVAATLEIKSNRNFYVVPASVDPARAAELSVVAYSFLPPAETFDMVDTEGTGNFNACVDGGRFRLDANVTGDLMVYAQGIYAYTKSEQPIGRCDALGRSLSGAFAGRSSDAVWDGVGGFEWYFDGQLSHAFVWTGARDDVMQSGGWFYREQHIEYSVVKYLGGSWSLELEGRRRNRREQNQNANDWWSEGESYVALKIAPKWVFTQGFEYTTLSGQPPFYWNGAAVYKFTSGSNVRIFVGQQRGAFRCASGLCRYFPPFEGARAELTLRF